MKRGYRAVSPAQTVNGSHQRDALVEAFIADHGSAVLSTARRFSQNAADAEDAFQRAFEKFLTKAPSIPEDEVLPWILTVVRNEALMIARSRNRLSFGHDEEYLAGEADQSPSPDELISDRETIAFGHVALRRLHPDQLRCLLLRADGLEYLRIQAVTGFSYAKVNRCLSDGRSALREGFARVASGAECRRLENPLSLFADGMLEASRHDELKRHLRECISCRATLREFRSAPTRVAATMPLAIFGLEAARDADSRFSGLLRQAVDGLQSVGTSIQERLGGFATMHQGADLAIAKKIALVSAVSASLVAGGVTAERAIEQSNQPAESQPNGVTGSTGQAPADTAPGAGDVDLGGLAQDAAEEAKPPRDPRASDLMGQEALVQLPDPGDRQPNPRGDSAVGPDSYVAPLPGGSDSSGSSDQSSDLAP